jgi:hypothetical protein
MPRNGRGGRASRAQRNHRPAEITSADFPVPADSDVDSRAPTPPLAREESPDVDTRTVADYIAGLDGVRAGDILRECAGDALQTLLTNAAYVDASISLIGRSDTQEHVRHNAREAFISFVRLLIGEHTRYTQLKESIVEYKAAIHSAENDLDVAINGDGALSRRAGSRPHTQQQQQHNNTPSASRPSSAYTTPMTRRSATSRRLFEDDDEYKSDD